MDTEDLLKWLKENHPLDDGFSLEFDAALLGFDERAGADPALLYHRVLCIRVFEKGINREERRNIPDIMSCLPRPHAGGAGTAVGKLCCLAEASVRRSDNGGQRT